MKEADGFVKKFSPPLNLSPAPLSTAQSNPQENFCSRKFLNGAWAQGGNAPWQVWAEPVVTLLKLYTKDNVSYVLKSIFFKCLYYMGQNMHITEGVLSPPVLIAGACLSAVGLWRGQRGLSCSGLVYVGFLTSVFFVTSFIRFPIGPASVHLLLSGLLGIMLGPAVFVAVFIGLFFQWLFFGFGGLTVLGVNTFNIAGSAFLCSLCFRPLITKKKPALGGFLCGFCSVGLAAFFMAVALILSGEHFYTAALAVFTANIPLMVIEGIILAFIVPFVLKVCPELIFSGPALCRDDSH